MADSVTESSPVPADEHDTTAVRKRLWESLSNRRRVTVDTGGLQRLLTFVEQPTFRNAPKRPLDLPPLKEAVSGHPSFIETPSLPQIEPGNGLRKISDGNLNRMQSFYPERTQIARSDTNLYSPRRISFLQSSNKAPIGGVPIEEETAILLRRRVYGSSIHSFSSEWRRNHLLLQDIRGHFPYGLATNRDGAKGLILIVNALLLRHLLFASHISDRFRTSYLRPNEGSRRECLVRALADLLWLAGNSRRRAVAVMTSDREYVEPSHNYRLDDITERLHLFTFKKLDEVRSFFRRNLQTFESPYNQGCILLLYSVALSRGLDQLLEDFEFNEKASLLGDNEELTQSCLSLLLTGIARPHVHNGTIMYDEEGSILDRPMFGVQERADIGLLWWDRSQLEDGNQPVRVGSMLRTPRYPIWLTRVNGQLGLLFSTSADLCCHWRSENSFVLYYYTGLATQSCACRLSVDTRRGRSGRASRFRNRLTTREDRKKVPALEQCILTKWYGAHVDWNGTVPFV